MSEPLYMKIVTEIRKRIFEGVYNPGDLIPSENELALSFSVSRVTIRKSLNVLDNEGYITPWHGKGYFVLTPDHNKFILDFVEFSYDQQLKLNNVKVIEPSEEIRKALALREGRKVILIRRIFTRQDLPIACDEKYIPYDKGMPLVEEEIKYADLPEVVAAKISPFALQTNLEIGIEFASEEISKELACENNEPLLVAYRYIKNQYGVRVAYGKRYMRKEYGRMKAYSGYSPSGNHK